MGKSVEQLANQQVLRWLKERSVSESAPPPSSSLPSQVRPSQRPMVTVSREYGACGAELGEMVSRILKIDFHAQELVHQIAAQADVRKQVVEALDERTQTKLQLWVDELISVRRFHASDYMRALSETIVAIGRHHRGVIIGRGAHLILDPRRTLRVRVYAPQEDRVHSIAQREGMSVTEAHVKVGRIDAERTEFFRANFDTDIANPLHYDLIINTSTIPLRAAAEVVAETYRQRFG